MQFLGKIENEKDLVTKEYVDGVIASSTFGNNQEVYIGSTEPTNEEAIWINPEGIPTKTSTSGAGMGSTYTAGTGISISDDDIISADGNAIINALSLDSNTPADADYYVSQYAGGGTTTTSYHRKPISALWTYIKSKMKLEGVAASADKLTTARTINGVNFDGSDNITVSDREWVIVSANSDSQGWYKVAEGTAVNALDFTTTLLITQTYNDVQSKSYGIISFGLRVSNNIIYINDLTWICRRGFSANHFGVVVDGLNYSLYVWNNRATYASTLVEVLSKNTRLYGTVSSIYFNLVKSTAPESTTPTITQYAVDEVAHGGALEDRSVQPTALHPYSLYSQVIEVTASRNITVNDFGKTLKVTSDNVVLTIPDSLIATSSTPYAQYGYWEFAVLQWKSPCTTTVQLEGATTYYMAAEGYGTAVNRKAVMTNAAYGFGHMISVKRITGATILITGNAEVSTK